MQITNENDPKVMNNHEQYINLALKLDSSNISYYLAHDANDSYIKILELSEEKEPKYLYEYGLYWNKYRGNFKFALLYIDLALKLDPKNLEYMIIVIAQKLSHGRILTFVGVHLYVKQNVNY